MKRHNQTGIMRIGFFLSFRHRLPNPFVPRDSRFSFLALSIIFFSFIFSSEMNNDQRDTVKKKRLLLSGNGAYTHRIAFCIASESNNFIHIASIELATPLLLLKAKHRYIPMCVQCHTIPWRVTVNLITISICESEILNPLNVELFIVGVACVRSLARHARLNFNFII